MTYVTYNDDMQTTPVVINLTIDPLTLTRIDRFWHQHGFPNRAKAIKFLIAWALDKKPKPEQKGV